VFLRHDIDFWPPAAVAMGEVERELGARATYFVRVAGIYNPAAPPHASAIRALVAQGHEVGLHYDLADYPGEPEGARAQLEREVAWLESISGARVATISAHEPHRMHGDMLREGTRFVHPHASAASAGVDYISDSCRAWRDDRLLEWLAAAPPRDRKLQWLTHPESWLGEACADRLAYLDQTLTPRVLAEATHYYRWELPSLWLTHAGGAAHDGRERGGPVSALVLDEREVQARLEELCGILGRGPELTWTAAQILAPRPRKFELSVGICDGAGALVGAAMASEVEGLLHVHAFAVAPARRRSGLGRRLLVVVAEHARRCALRGVQLRVHTTNHAALALYLSAGFALARSEPEQSQLLLRRLLNPPAPLHNADS
jgi:ribosomal protein S18 acetylase RimI-like enzyme